MKYLSILLLLLIIIMSSCNRVINQESNISYSSSFIASNLEASSTNDNITSSDSQSFELSSETKDIDKNTILILIQDTLKKYKDNLIKSDIPENGEGQYEDMPKDFSIPESLTIDDLVITKNQYLGGYNVRIPSSDKLWYMDIWVMTYIEDDITCYNVAAASFIKNS